MAHSDETSPYAASEVMRPVLAVALDHATRHLAGLPDRPVAPAAAAGELRALLGGGLPEGPEDPAATVARLAEAGAAGTMASPGPRFFGFVMGGALPAAVGADMLVTA